MEKLERICRCNKKIYIYGAGINANYVYLFLKNRGIKVEGFLVSDPQKNPDHLYGLPIIGIKNFQKDQTYFILVSVVRESMAYTAIFNCLVEHKMQNVFFISSPLMAEIKKELKIRKLKQLFEKEQYHLGEEVPVERYHFIFTMSGTDGQEYHWRFKDVIVGQLLANDEINLFPQRTPLEEFEEQYGTYYTLHTLQRDDAVPEKTYSVYMAQSHVDQAPLQCAMPKWVLPIQVGATLTKDKICEIRDDLGIHISEKNRIYSECTALYWIWKNAPRTDYVGLCHYRRHFDISEQDWRNLMKSDIDVLATTPTFIQEGIGNFFSQYISNSDMEQLLKAIEDLWPEYLQTANAFLNARFFPPCNLAVMKYELFQKYAEFVFSITFRIEDYYRSLQFHREDRYMGYLIECLLGIFLMYHKENLKIAYTDMLFYS